MLNRSDCFDNNWKSNSVQSGIREGGKSIYLVPNIAVQSYCTVHSYCAVHSYYAGAVIPPNNLSIASTSARLHIEWKNSGVVHALHTWNLAYLNLVCSSTQALTCPPSTYRTSQPIDLQQQRLHYNHVLLQVEK